MTLEQLIERLREIQRVHPHADVKFYIESERGSKEWHVEKAEYFHVGKVVLLEP